MPTRMVAIEGWLEVKYGPVTKEEATTLPSEELNRRYWVQIVGGYMSWYTQEDHGVTSFSVWFSPLLPCSFPPFLLWVCSMASISALVVKVLDWED